MPWPEGGICTADGWKLLACAISSNPAPLHLAGLIGRISFYRLNIKNESRLQGLIKMADLVGWLPDLLLLLLVVFYFVDFAADDFPLFPLY